MKLQDQIQQIRNLIPRGELLSQSVSSWPVGYHIQHLSLAMSGVAKALELSTPPVPRQLPKPAWLAIGLMGRIPRGKAQSPDISRPKHAKGEEELNAFLEKAESRIITATQLPDDRWFKHHLLGVLDKRNSLKFVRIHNDHHLAIMKDIVRDAEGSR